MYRPAHDVAKIAADLIETVPRHENLEHARIEYVFIDKHPTSRGRVVLGRARKVSGLNAYLADKRPHEEVHVDPTPFFVIEISDDTWTFLDEDGRRALVDHELCHCCVSFDEGGEVLLSMRGHDFEEFAEIIRRHGLWSSGNQAIGAVVSEQLALAIDGIETYVEGLTTPEPDHGDDTPGDA